MPLLCRAEMAAAADAGAAAGASQVGDRLPQVGEEVRTDDKK